MSVLTYSQFSGTYLTTTGVWPDNQNGDITPADLRAGIKDTWDSFVSIDSNLSGLLAEDIVNLANISGRVTNAENNITTLDGRLDVAEADILTDSGRINTANSNILTDSGRITFLENSGLYPVNRSISPTNGSILVYNSSASNWVPDSSISMPSGIMIHSGVWRDMVADLSRSPVTANSPTYSAWMSGIYAYSFPSNLNKELFVSFHVDHDWMPGTALYPHIHWAPSTATLSGSWVKWGIEYTVAKGHQQQAFPNSTLVYISGQVLGIQNMHHITETSLAAAIPGSGIEVDSLIMMRIFRDTSVSGNYSQPVWGLYCDLHYLSDREGTKNKAPNFYI